MNAISTRDLHKWAEQDTKKYVLRKDLVEALREATKSPDWTVEAPSAESIVLKAADILERGGE